MSTDLREELDALARTQTFSPDPSAWDRGRRARRRTQVLAVAAAAVVVASVTGVVFSLAGEDRELRTASSDDVVDVGVGAIPSRIEDIPDDLGSTEDLAVGRASAAFVSGEGEPVVITAADGVPHKLALPAFGPDRAAFALSPDGRTLAFQQLVDDGTRVVLLDLETGTSKPLLVHAGDRLEIDGLTWSPGGRWVGWVAPQMGQVPAWAGRIRATGRESRRITTPSSMSSVAVADDGNTVFGGVNGGLFTWAGESDLPRVSTDLSAGVGAFSPDGRRLALATAPGTASYTLDVAGREVLEHPFPDGTFGEAVVRPLGWLDDRLQLLLVHETAGRGAELVVTTPEVDATSTWRRSIGSVATTGVANSLSVAVDLIPDLDGTSSQELTHDFGDTTDEPPAPLGIELSLFIGLAVAAAIAVLMALQWLWRRLA